MLWLTNPNLEKFTPEKDVFLFSWNLSGWSKMNKNRRRPKHVKLFRGPFLAGSELDSDDMRQAMMVCLLFCFFLFVSRQTTLSSSRWFFFISLVRRCFCFVGFSSFFLLSLLIWYRARTVSAWWRLRLPAVYYVRIITYPEEREIDCVARDPALRDGAIRLPRQLAPAADASPLVREYPRQTQSLWRVFSSWLMRFDCRHVEILLLSYIFGATTSMTTSPFSWCQKSERRNKTRGPWSHRVESVQQPTFFLDIIPDGPLGYPFRRSLARHCTTQLVRASLFRTDKRTGSRSPCCFLLFL